MLKVNLVIAGVQKGGTTTLFEHLRNHPDVAFAASKELHVLDDRHRFASLSFNVAAEYDHAFFGPKSDPESEDQAKARLEKASRAKYRCDATPIYSYWPNAIERLRNYNPEARIVLIYRDPIERAYSHWQMEHGKEHDPLTFSDAIRVGRARAYEDPLAPGYHRSFSCVERGFYADQLRRVLDCFPREQVLLLENRMLRNDLVGTLAEIWNFLAVEPPTVEPEAIYANTSSGDRSEMDPLDGAYLYSIYRQDMAAFSELSGLDVSHWGSKFRSPAPQIRPLSVLQGPRRAPLRLRHNGPLPMALIVLGAEPEGAAEVRDLLARAGVPAPLQFSAPPRPRKSIEATGQASQVETLGRMFKASYMTGDGILSVGPGEVSETLDGWVDGAREGGFQPRPVVVLPDVNDLLGGVSNAVMAAKLGSILDLELRTRGLIRSFVSQPNSRDAGLSCLTRIVSDLNLSAEEEIGPPEPLVRPAVLEIMEQSQATYGDDHFPIRKLACDILVGLSEAKGLDAPLLHQRFDQFREQLEALQRQNVTKTASEQAPVEPAYAGWGFDEKVAPYDASRVPVDQAEIQYLKDRIAELERQLQSASNPTGLESVRTDEPGGSSLGRFASSVRKLTRNSRRNEGGEN